MFDNKMGFGVYYSQDNRMPPVKPIWKSSKSCNKLPLELKSGGDVWNAKDGVVNIGSRSCRNIGIVCPQSPPCQKSGEQNF